MFQAFAYCTYCIRQDRCCSFGCCLFLSLPSASTLSSSSSSSSSLLLHIIACSSSRCRSMLPTCLLIFTYEAWSLCLVDTCSLTRQIVTLFLEPVTNTNELLPGPADTATPAAQQYGLAAPCDVVGLRSVYLYCRDWRSNTSC